MKSLAEYCHVILKRQSRIPGIASSLLHSGHFRFAIAECRWLPPSSCHIENRSRQKFGGTRKARNPQFVEILSFQSTIENRKSTMNVALTGSFCTLQFRAWCLHWILTDRSYLKTITPPFRRIEQEGDVRHRGDMASNLTRASKLSVPLHCTCL